jgi:signal transduction histidine kinase
MDGAHAVEHATWLTTRAQARETGRAWQVYRGVLGVLLVAIAGALAVVPIEPLLLIDPAFAALGVALLVGALITVPWHGGGSPSSLLIVPLMSAYWRFGPAAAPLLLFATVLANGARGASWVATLSAAAVDLAVFGAAWLVAAEVPDLRARSAVFAASFAVLRVVLWWALDRRSLAPTTSRRVDRPDLTLSLILAPLGAVPIIVGDLLGDGGLLLALAGVLPVLSVVGEWWRLRVARAEAEAERDRLVHARTVHEELTHLITHEVRTPLTTVLGYCQMAQSAVEAHPDDPGAVTKHLDRIFRAGKTIERLTENLLQLTKMETPGEQKANERVDLGEIVRDVVAEIEPLAEQKQQQLVIDVPERAPIAWASPVLLREALNNLASNAVKYTPEGGSVRIWASEGPEPGMSVVGVTDSGVGLSEHDKRRLFTKFFRSDDPRVARERGAGLGLALTHAIIQRMGGDIVVESQLNEGATFRVLLPSASEGS